MNTETLFGIIFGYAFYNLFCPLPHKKCGLKYNQISSGAYKVHLHHWLISLILLFIIDYNKIEINSFIKGIIMSGLIHGITEYQNWYILIKNNA
jgi:hypothetical protein